MKRFVCLAVLAATVCVGRSAIAQYVPPGQPTGLEFSGLIYGSFNVRTDSASKASLGGKAPNQFGIDRVYLNFRLPAGDNGLIRITTDVFQNLTAPGNAFYQGWVIRLKYAYFQYTGLRDALGAGSNLSGRVGSVHDVAIDQQESSWPRYLQPPPVERALFFSSADVGVAGLLTLANKKGEVYGEIVNGPGYAFPERDRFKDFGLRLTLTPFASSTTMNGFAKTILIVPWVYRGMVGSAFASGGPGQTGPGLNGAITDGMPRNRYGIFVGEKDRRLAIGADIADRIDGTEAGTNTAGSPRTASDSTGRLVDAYVISHPFEWSDPSKRSPFSVILRYDRMTPNINPTSPNYAGTTPAYRFTIVGAAWELTQRISVALDWQVQTPIGYPDPTGANVRPVSRQSTLFAHWNSTF